MDKKTTIAIMQGKVNRTTVIYTEDGPYIRQYMNRAVFGKSMSMIEENYRSLRAAYEKCVRLGITGGLLIPEWRFFKESGSYFRADGNGEYIREYPLIPAKESSYPGSPKEYGRALARLHRILDEVEGEMQDVIPHFHDIVYYEEEYHRVRKDETHRRGFVEDTDFERELEEVLESRRASVGNLFEKGNKIPRKVIHGDTKWTNFLMDEEGKVIAMLDLDTLSMGERITDLADALRSLCALHPAEERKTITREFMDGYIGEGFVTKEEISVDQLEIAQERLYLELALRYYTDHLSGNRYFPVIEDGQNLKRAKENLECACQMHL